MLQGVDFKLTRGAVLGAVAAVLALSFGLLTAETASAQGPGSEFCEEYPDFPGCETGPTGSTGTTGPTGVEGPTGAGGPSAGADANAAGTLPFTGYPLTALILLLLILLLVGIAIRAYLAVRDRIGGDPPVAP